MVKIEIVSDMKKKMEEENKYLEAVISGKIKPKRAVHTIVFTPETFASTFSPERVRLIFALKDWDGNIYRLAKKLGRPYEAVHRDISYLESFGFIKVKSIGRKRYPHLAGPIRIPAFA
ncbi:hypothetical protein HYY73_01545 [Candidatus Woesearchaeota archaeon]|nr:hypothetical protein [Candidatus Woesearchaeota archaeon]